jgi:hypothetical protein
MFLLLVLVALFGVGYATRSYVGALVPGVVFVLVALMFLQSAQHPSPPGMGDEVDVLPAIYLGASSIGVLLYLGGVALGRFVGRSSGDA